MISGIVVRLTRRPAGPGRNAWCRRSGRRIPRARYPGAPRSTRAPRCRGRCSRATSRRLPRCCTSRAGRTAHIRSLSPGTAQTWSQVACTAPALPSKNLIRIENVQVACQVCWKVLTVLAGVNADAARRRRAAQPEVSRADSRDRHHRMLRGHTGRRRQARRTLLVRRHELTFLVAVAFDQAEAEETSTREHHFLVRPPLVAPRVIDLDRVLVCGQIARVRRGPIVPGF